MRFAYIKNSIILTVNNFFNRGHYFNNQNICNKIKIVDDFSDFHESLLIKRATILFYIYINIITFEF